MLEAYVSSFNTTHPNKNGFKFPKLVVSRYYRNESMFDEEDGYSYTLTFSINFPHDNDTVYLAHCYPYTYRLAQIC